MLFRSWQMWVTHSAMESELRLLRQGMEYTFNCVFWVPDGERGAEWEGEWEGAEKHRVQEGEREGAEEHGVLEEAREGEETLE